jgi:hypothetical protein
MKYDPINYQVIGKFGWNSFETVYVYLHIVLFVYMNLLTADHAPIMTCGEYRIAASRVLQTCNLLWKYISMGNTQNGIRLRAIKCLQENIGLNIFTQFDFSTQVMTFCLAEKWCHFWQILRNCGLVWSCKNNNFDSSRC